MARVFLSYDHDDFALAKPLAGALEKAGHTVWYDRHIHGGAQFSQKIEQALDEADAVLVLWSPSSIDSAWVRDEAAEGRDRNKLVPLSVGAISPPMGFRQYQTIDMGAWKGRGRVPRLDQILDAIGSQAASEIEGGLPPSPARHAPPLPRERPRWLVPAAVAVLVVAVLGLAGWKWLGGGGLPVVEVAAANPSPRSQAAASDLYVKLGSLAQIGEGKWQLVDAASAPARPDLVFRAADTGTAAAPQASLILLDGKDHNLLWSREFEPDGGSDADLRQRMALDAGRVLACALEAGDAGGLRRDTFKLFLRTCATSVEAGSASYESTIAGLRAVLKENPAFLPAWSRLIPAELTGIDFATFTNGDLAGRTAQLRADMATVRKLDPNLPALTLAEVAFLPKTAYAKALALLDRAAASHPEDTQLLAEQGSFAGQVGRMIRAAELAKRVAELDPLSPVAANHYIMALAYAGQIEQARRELAKAERLWAGTGALRDTLWAFHLRFGDPEIARRNGDQIGDWMLVYLDARAGRPGASAHWLRFLRSYAARPLDSGWGMALQGFGGFGTVDEMFALLAKVPSDQLAEGSYLLFRPALDALRRDPRFMAVANRAGLVAYWRSSGDWPDFCLSADRPYDCRAEAAKYAA